MESRESCRTERLPVSLLLPSHLFHFKQKIVNLVIFPVHGNKWQQLAIVQPDDWKSKHAETQWQTSCFWRKVRFLSLEQGRNLDYGTLHPGLHSCRQTEWLVFLIRANDKDRSHLSNISFCHLKSSSSHSESWTIISQSRGGRYIEYTWCVFPHMMVKMALS